MPVYWSGPPTWADVPAPCWSESQARLDIVHHAEGGTGRACCACSGGRRASEGASPIHLAVPSASIARASVRLIVPKSGFEGPVVTVKVSTPAGTQPADGLAPADVT